MTTNYLTKVFSIYYPEDVTAFLSTGTSSYIGLVDETPVLKCPHISGDEETRAFLGLEARILRAIGTPKHFIGFNRYRLWSRGQLFKHWALINPRNLARVCSKLP